MSGFIAKSLGARRYKATNALLILNYVKNHCELVAIRHDLRGLRPQRLRYSSRY